MNATPKQPLVELVANAIDNAQTMANPLTFTSEHLAQAALDACHAEELLKALHDLLEDTQHQNHDCGDSEHCPVLRARALLAKVDGKPSRGAL